MEKSFLSARQIKEEQTTPKLLMRGILDLIEPEDVVLADKGFPLTANNLSNILTKYLVSRLLPH